MRTLSFVVLTILLLLPTTYAVNVNAAFENSFDSSKYHFNTDMSVNTDFTISSDGNAVQPGSPVCSANQVTITPSIIGKWATSKLDAIASYPNCYGSTTCPSMVPGPSLSTNKDIGWLSTSTFDKYYKIAQGNDFSDGSVGASQYYELGSKFHNEPVTFSNDTGVFQDKEAEVNVFCKGTVEILDGNSVISSQSADSLQSLKYIFSSSGQHEITTRMKDISCIGTVVKHPLDIDNKFFRINYFGYNGPSFPSPTASKTASVNVQDSSGTCKLDPVSLQSSNLADGISLVKATVSNSGDPVEVVTVSSSSSDYYATDANSNVCNFLSISLCPSSTGFNETIAKNSNKDLYVILVGSGPLPTLNFAATTVGGSCGSKSCNVQFQMSNFVGGAQTCSVSPSSINLGTKEVGHFEVKCKDLGNQDVPCTGDWAWSSNLKGDFMSKSQTFANAFTTNSPGLKGQLIYTMPKTGSPDIVCASDITIVPPTYGCTLNPGAANLKTGDVEKFGLQCTIGGAPVGSSGFHGVIYSLVNGLQGSLSDDSVNGVTYNTPANPTGGKLQSFAEFGSSGTILGAIATATIIVSANGTTGTNATNETGQPPVVPECKNCGKDEGATKFCTIGNGPFNAYSGFKTWIGIKCGPQADQPCGNVEWLMDPPLAGTVSGGTASGTYVTITGEAGQKGVLKAVVDVQGNGCSKPFTIQDLQCVMLS